MEILAKPELHRIMIITKGPRVTLPEILKNKAQVFKVSEPYENQVENYLIEHNVLTDVCVTIY
jgi:hypothetical protein